MQLKCFLKCVNGLHEPILLEDQKPLILGRSKITKIKDNRCSKEQVKFTANFKEFKVVYNHIGSNDGGFKGEVAKCGETYDIFHKDTLEFLFGQYPHEIVFDPEPHEFMSSTMQNDKIPNEAKRKSSESSNRKDCFSVFKRKGTNAEESCNKKMCTNSSEYIWESFNNNELLIYNKNFPKSHKIAAYDMDGTLITTVSGRVFAKDINDWKIIYSEVPGKLKQLYKEGFKVVLFTNQAGVGRGKMTVEDIQSKVANIIKKIGVPAQALISTGKGKYRKPITGMWDYFIQECNEGIHIDMVHSFYVGDAAGRKEIPKQRKKDHSVCDRLFALNIGIPFYTPEEHFLGHKPLPYNMPEFIPSEIDTSVSLYSPTTTKVPNHPLEIILLVGYPGSGKSTFVNKHLLKIGYIQANRDSIGSWQKCISLMEKSLQEGKHVVIDNTNPDKESRGRYIAVAKREMIPIRCFKLDVSLSQAKHNNKFREITGSDHTKVNDMIYNMYKSKYEEPSIDEGFSEIIKVNFVPSFKNSEMEKIYKMFLLEK